MPHGTGGGYVASVRRLLTPELGEEGGRPALLGDDSRLPRCSTQAGHTIFRSGPVVTRRVGAPTLLWRFLRGSRVRARGGRWRGGDASDAGRVHPVRVHHNLGPGLTKPRVHTVRDTRRTVYSCHDRSLARLRDSRVPFNKHLTQP